MIRLSFQEDGEDTMDLSERWDLRLITFQYETFRTSRIGNHFLLEMVNVYRCRMQANGRSFQSYSFSFTEPWLGGRKPHSFSVSYVRSISRYAGQGATSYNDLNSMLKADNFSVGLGRMLEWPDNYFSLTNSLGYAIYTLKNIDYGIGCTNCASHAITFNTTLSRNSVDNQMYPSQGSTISLSLVLTPPYSAFNDLDYDNGYGRRKEQVAGVSQVDV